MKDVLVAAAREHGTPCFVYFLDEIRAQAEYDLVGPLCTSIDTLGHRVKLPTLDVGDVIAVRCSGAYGPSASPVFFIHYPPPKEILAERIDDAVMLRDISDLSP